MQIDVDAVGALDDMRVDGLDGVCLGFSDLAGSMGLPGQQARPDVIAMGEDDVRRTRQADQWMGLSMGWDPWPCPRGSTEACNGSASAAISTTSTTATRILHALRESGDG